MVGHATESGQYLDGKAEKREGRAWSLMIWGQAVWSWRAGWDRRSRFEVRIVATVAYIVPSFSFPVELSNISLMEVFSSMISSEFMSGLLMELNMGKLGC